MCGIAGIFNSHADEPVPSALLERLVDGLAHRGPDQRGCLIRGSVGLGVARLSIVDVEGGSQPMSSEDGALQLAYNGEVYNHGELRQELLSLGQRFRTRCDTEVVLLGYRQWGLRGLLERLDGIFAFALWDARSQTGHLCRDRLGVKPLHYVDRNGRFVFASELRALATSGLLRARVDDEALWGYLLYQFSPEERTLLAGALKLPAAHFLTWRAGRATCERYWDFPQGGETDGGSLEQNAATLRVLLTHTIERQMMGDQPAGCFLSGGLDSSFVAAAMARVSRRPLRTYSASFPDTPACDESAHFESLARELGALHTTVPFSHRDVLEHFEHVTWAADEPLADPAMLPTYLLARAAARDVKVVLTGEGADEVFAGYPYYRELAAPESPSGTASARPSPHWRRLTEDLWRTLGFLVPAPRNDQRSRLSGFPYALDARFLWHLLALDHRPELARLETLAARVEARALAGLEGASRLQQALGVDTRLWLGNDLMPKLDRMTMAHSLEGRVPFLDHHLVEFAFRLPGAQKLGEDGQGKRVLREAARGLVPESVRARHKQGFNVPLREWFRGPLQGLLRETLLGEGARALGLFDARAVAALVDAHTRLDFNAARPLFQLMCLTGWLRRLREHASPFDPVTHPLEIRSARPAPSATAPAWACDVIVPVYEGLNYVRDLLRSLERHTAPGSFRVLLVDDSARAATHEALRRLAAPRPWVALVRNPENVGFVASCNRGIAETSAPYVCLLNTDTLVTAGWLERLLAAARSDPRIAAVNPLSNKAVNLSVPLPPGYDLDSLGRKLDTLSRRTYPDVTTAVGFCLLLDRRFLDWLGAFDPAYGFGYCEESDLCMRFTEAGLRVVVADDAFVYHKGCGSFGTWLERYERNRAVFDQRYEDAYERDYRRFLQRNPLQPLRDALLRHTLPKRHWSARLARSLDGRIARRRLRLAAELALAPGQTARKVWAVTSAAGRRAGRWLAGSAAPVDPEQRSVRYPTRAYVDGIPRAGGLRVTFLVADMPLCGGVISIVQLCREFLLSGVNVTLATLSEELAPERFNLPAQPLVFPDAETLVRCFPQSDVVVATFWSTAHDFLPELRRRYDCLSVYFVQDYEAYFYPEHELAIRERVASTYGLAERRIVKSAWLASLIERRHGQACDIVPLGLDLGIFRERGRARDPGTPQRVACVARPHEPRRGFAQAVEAFRRVHAQRPETELVFFGARPDELPTGLGFPYVNVGLLEDQNAVAELISSCDVLVDPSLHQAFGRPGLEAMACGTGTVLTSEGGVSEYARHEQNCLLVPPGDPQALAAATLRLLGDAQLSARLRAGGHTTAARYSHVEEARRHLELYETWLREKREGRCATEHGCSRPQDAR